MTVQITVFFANKIVLVYMVFKLLCSSVISLIFYHRFFKKIYKQVKVKKLPFVALKRAYYMV